MNLISPETRMMGLPYGEEIMIVGRTMCTQCTSVTDRQTDRRTDRITITKTVQRMASHGKKPRVCQTLYTLIITKLLYTITLTRSTTMHAIARSFNYLSTKWVQNSKLQSLSLIGLPCSVTLTPGILHFDKWHIQHYTSD